MKKTKLDEGSALWEAVSCSREGNYPVACSRKPLLNGSGESIPGDLSHEATESSEPCAYFIE
jgi:hypothetical protein